MTDAPKPQQPSEIAERQVARFRAYLAMNAFLSDYVARYRLAQSEVEA